MANLRKWQLKNTVYEIHIDVGSNDVKICFDKNNMVSFGFFILFHFKMYHLWINFIFLKEVVSDLVFRAAYMSP